MECDPHDPCAKPKKVIDWQPGCATQRTRHKLIKHETIEEVKSFKWVVDNVCDRCAAQTPAAAPITADATPLPPDAPQPVSRPLTEDDLKQPKWRSYLSFGKK
jgi:hypothetical protein